MLPFLLIVFGNRGTSHRKTGTKLPKNTLSLVLFDTGSDVYGCLSFHVCCLCTCLPQQDRKAQPPSRQKARCLRAAGLFWDGDQREDVSRAPHGGPRLVVLSVGSRRCWVCGAARALLRLRPHSCGKRLHSRDDHQACVTVRGGGGGGGNLCPSGLSSGGLLPPEGKSPTRAAQRGR